MRILSFSERIEKARAGANNPHVINSQGLEALRTKFDGNAETDFTQFIQFIFVNAFKEGMIEAIRIIEDPYDR